jgi:hypothetical protein
MLGHTCGFAIMQENSSVHVSQFEGFGVVQDNTLCLARNARRCVVLGTFSLLCNICAVVRILAW